MQQVPASFAQEAIEQLLPISKPSQDDDSNTVDQGVENLQPPDVDSPTSSEAIYEVARRCCGEPAEPECKGLKHQVFISHTGQDEGAKTFAASILEPALRRAGLGVYIDFKSLNYGEHWKQKLVEAAASSQVVVVVLSESYTTRFWCMLELDLALKGLPSGLKPVIIPVFYDEWEQVNSGPAKVKRSKEEVKWEGIPSESSGGDKCEEVNSGPAKVTRSKEEVKWEGIPTEWSGDKLQQWLKAEDLGTEWGACVDAQRWVQNVKFMQAIQHQRSTSFTNKDAKNKMATVVVKEALKHVVRGVHVGNNVVGLEERAAELLDNLAVQGRGTPPLLGMWLHGFGGLGKTTLATHLYSCLSFQRPFVHCAFMTLEGTGDNTRYLKAALTSLRQNAEGSEPELGARLRKFVKDEAVLYVLDNVEGATQLNALLPTAWGNGSVVLVTSRSKEFIGAPPMASDPSRLCPHSVEGLDEIPALALFRTHSAWGTPPAGLEQLERDIVNRCSGVPLALKIAGGLVQRSVDKDQWEDVCGCLLGDKAVEALLQHSWEVLDDASKNMFLDVATLLRHRSYEEVKPVWRAWHGNRSSLLFQDLERRCLVELKEDSEDDSDDDSATFGKKTMEMHDLLAELGRAKVLDPESEHCGSRLWVEGHKVMGCEQAAAKRAKVLCAQLDVDDVVHDGRVKPWTDAPPTMTHAPAALDLSQARILLLGRRVKKYAVATAVWVHLYEASNVGAWVHGAKGLVLLQAPECSVQGTLPESLGQLSALRELDLQRCTGLVSLPSNVWQLGSLKSLTLRGLKSLPEALRGLNSLTSLNLAGCTALESLPEALGGLTALASLDLQECTSLKSLPVALGGLSALTGLELYGCTALESLPESLGGLSALPRLWLGGCTGLKSLPEALGGLSALSRLDLGGCTALESLPVALGGLSALQGLHLSRCTRLESLPESLGGLSALTSLSLELCSGLMSLPDALWGLSALKELDLRYCNSLTSLPEGLGGLSSLTKLDLKGCRGLKSLPESLGGLSALTSLSLEVCSGLTSLPEALGGLSALKELNLGYCNNLTSLPEALGGLSALKELNLRYCNSLTSLPVALGGLSALTSLQLWGCTGLTSLPEGLGGLSALTSLHLGGCTGLTALPAALGGLSALKELDLGRCVSLTSLPESVGRLGSLRRLGLRGCKGLTSLPASIEQLGALEWLNLGGCSGLMSRPQPMVRRTSLTTLYLYACDGLRGHVVQWPAGCKVITEPALDEYGREVEDDDIRLWELHC